MKLAILTGGSKGLGKALVEILDQHTWQVKEFSRSGQSEFNVPCDLTDVETAEKIFCHELSRLSTTPWQQIAFISNAADLSPIISASQLKSNDIIKNISVNQCSAYVFICAFMSQFRNTQCRKSIINISSGAASKAYAGWSLYCACKAASENFINTIALEEQNQRFPFVTVNFNPGIIDTDMQATIRQSSKIDFPSKDRFVDFKENNQLQSAHSVASSLFKQLGEGFEQQ